MREPKPTVEPGWNSHTHTAKAADIHVAPLSRDFSTGAEVFVVNRSCSQSMNSRCRWNSTTGSITGSPALALPGFVQVDAVQMKSAGLARS